LLICIFAGINLDPATASKVDGEKLGSLMMYNMISGAGVDVEAEGSPAGLLAKQSIQTLLGAAYNDQLPITFSASGSNVSEHLLSFLCACGNAVLAMGRRGAGRGGTSPGSPCMWQRLCWS